MDRLKVALEAGQRLLLEDPTGALTEARVLEVAMDGQAVLAHFPYPAHQQFTEWVTPEQLFVVHVLPAPHMGPPPRTTELEDRGL